MERVLVGDKDILIVVDVQNDFCTGSLAVPDAEAIVPVLNELGTVFDHIVLTQDWHPTGHVSFASSHPGCAPGDTVTASYGQQSVFADHCVRGTTGAELHPGLQLGDAELILRKGCRRDVDSFSAFMENDRRSTTGLAAYLQARGIERVFVAGLSLHGCVRFTALDSCAAGFRTYVIDDASRGRPNPGVEEAVAVEFQNAGVTRILRSEIQPAARSEMSLD